MIRSFTGTTHDAGREELRAALVCRQQVDRLLASHPGVSQLALDAAGNLEAVELCEILDGYLNRARGQAQAAMALLVADEISFGRFSAARQREIERISTGWPWLAQRRYQKLHEGIRKDTPLYRQMMAGR